MTLRAALDEIVEQMNEVKGVRYAPDDPTDSTQNLFPFVAVFPESGRYTGEFGSLVRKGVHNIAIELHDCLHQGRVNVFS